MRLALYGGVGSGKSAALGYLKKAYGAVVIGTDQVVHDLYRPGEPGEKVIRSLLGDGVLSPDGTLDRAKMAAVLYEDAELLREVGKRIHPLAWAESEKRMTEAENAGAKLVVLETALPSGEKKYLFDEIWYIYASKEIRAGRLKRDRGYSDERIRDIMAKQLSDEAYEALSDFILVNEGTPEALYEAIDRRLSGRAEKIV